MAERREDRSIGQLPNGGSGSHILVRRDPLFTTDPSAAAAFSSINTG